MLGLREVFVCMIYESMRVKMESLGKLEAIYVTSRNVAASSNLGAF